MTTLPLIMRPCAFLENNEPIKPEWFVCRTSSGSTKQPESASSWANNRDRAQRLSKTCGSIVAVARAPLSRILSVLSC